MNKNNLIKNKSKINIVRALDVKQRDDSLYIALHVGLYIRVQKFQY